MKKLWIAASVVAALSVLAGGAVKLATTSSPVQAQTVVPLHTGPTPEGCMSSRIQVPVAGGGLQWNRELMCPDSE